MMAVFGAGVVAVAAAMASIEVGVRMRWDERRGMPGFYMSDPILGQRLTPGYDGWFAGVPVRINSLGFRDLRDYTVKKPAGTFRILVFGDSVTFGHGALFETTYPFLLEARLKAWRPDVNWEVWNLSVPGYNTSQELAYLKEVGGPYDPDLVIVGFYENDLADNAQELRPTWLARARSAVQRTMQRWLYSYEFYRRVALTLRWRLTTDARDDGRLRELEGESVLLGRVEGAGDRPEQRLTEVEYLDDDAVNSFACLEEAVGDARADSLVKRLRSTSGEVAAWRRAVAELQRLNREGIHRVMFFINMAPRICPDGDRFADGGSLQDDETLSAVLGEGTHVASSTRAFLHYRPSQMPAASGHSIGNSNRVKAEVLFDYLKARVLPPLLSPMPASF
ncbi:MAG: SGNH/GDSL hydrolase family protein [Vicinamibacterales bacterium]